MQYVRIVKTSGTPQVTAGNYWTGTLEGEIAFTAHDDFSQADIQVQNGSVSVGIQTGLKTLPNDITQMPKPPVNPLVTQPVGTIDPNPTIPSVPLK